MALACGVLKAGVHVWVKDIQKLANLTNRSFPESAAEEIHFWSSIGEALEMTNTELRSEELRGGAMDLELKGVIIKLKRHLSCEINFFLGLSCV